MDSYTQYPVTRVNPVTSDFIRNLSATRPQNNDLEVIDLDGERDVKPTTWHS